MKQSLEQVLGALFVVAAFGVCAWVAAGPIAGLLAAFAASAMLAWQHAKQSEQLRPARTRRRGLERRRSHS